MRRIPPARTSRSGRSSKNVGRRRCRAPRCLRNQKGPPKRPSRWWRLGGSNPSGAPMLTSPCSTLNNLCPRGFRLVLVNSGRSGRVWAERVWRSLRGEQLGTSALVKRGQRREHPAEVFDVGTRVEAVPKGRGVGRSRSEWRAQRTDTTLCTTRGAAEHPPACALNAGRLPRAGGAGSACAGGETAPV